MSKLNLLGTIELSSSRLIMRKFTMNDAQNMYDNWASDPEVSRYVVWETHKNVEETKQVIKSWIEKYSPLFYEWVVVHKESNEIIGSFSLFKIDPSLKKAEIGYCFAKKYWGQGYGTEACMLVLKYAFEVIGLEFVSAYHIKENIASGRVMQKCGMSFITEETRVYPKYNHETTLLCYGISKNEWDKNIYRITVLENCLEIPTYKSLKDYNKVNNTIVFEFSKNTDTYENDLVEFNKYYDRYILATDDISLEKTLINQLHKHRLIISAAESCTGGMLISRLIGVSGASFVINESYVTYSEEAKQQILNVKEAVIKKYGVVSGETAAAMAAGLKKRTRADVTISVTGYAGGEEIQETDGLFYFAIMVDKYTHVEMHQVRGDRNTCRISQVNYILWRLKTILDRYYP